MPKRFRQWKKKRFSLVTQRTKAPIPRHDNTSRPFAKNYSFGILVGIREQTENCTGINVAPVNKNPCHLATYQLPDCNVSSGSSALSREELEHGKMTTQFFRLKRNKLDTLVRTHLDFRLLSQLQRRHSHPSRLQHFVQSPPGPFSSPTCEWHPSLQ